MSAPVVITGAGGFVGRHTVAYARQSGLDVRALVRPGSTVPSDWPNDPGITVYKADLAGDTPLADMLEHAGAVIHAAAAMTGNHDRDTIRASRNLIAQIAASGVGHVVLVSSLSVCDVSTLADHETLCEDCPSCARGRDAYAQAKLEQEHLFRDGAAQHGFTLTILRPGAVYGPGRAFNAHIGPSLGAVMVMVDGGGTVPLCQVGLLAQCLVHAARRPNGIETINIFDDALPDRDHFLSAFRQCGWPRLALFMPLGLMRLLARITPDSTAMPGLLRSDVLEARHKPLRYSNALMHERLGPVTMMPFEQAMQQAIQIEQDQTP
ncbi:NAD-dependent epimerase/dehydratase family protein [Thiosulfatihalobacter marinus]|uniref:NAD-dependent epimerase/dehydratase family protein n=1 Tax=Thiosulfatihalobacter marinus TaxID=2792481 RepID=UPI0018D78B4C|nr:NAD(P)-dependent oxidoreductase [Thiosulfatihalobacter marinus]